MATQSVYETLYCNIKDRFTVVNNNCEYTLGDYMRMKAGAKSKKNNLPVANSVKPAPITAFFKYVNDKLALKAPPVKDKTIRAFPFRTSIAALCSAILACTVIFSYGTTVALRGSDTKTDVMIAEDTENEDTQDAYEINK
jgi:hypothetical protein